MWNDEIVEETRQVRDRYAAKFNYDLDAIYCDLKKQQEQDSDKFTSPPQFRSSVSFIQLWSEGRTPRSSAKPHI